MLIASLAVVATVVACVSIVLNILLWKRALPWPDNGSFVLICKDNFAWTRVVETLRRFDINPAFRIDTDQVRRAIYRNGLIVNSPDKDMLEKLGHPGGAFMIPSENPGWDALHLKKRLNVLGYSATVVQEKGMEKKIVIVSSDAFVAGAIGFRLPMFKLGMPPKWHD
jgi:hypothetical protein